jgi:hypothetical protein
MESFIRAQSAGEIFRNSVRIYLHNFWILVAVSIPSILLTTVALTLVRGGATKWWLAPCLPIAVLMIIPMTVAVSDICIGNRPSVARAYRRTFGNVLARLLETYTIFLLIFVGGLILLFVPALSSRFGTPLLCV